ncbi:MAG: leucine-rich repeat protein [Clostridia bacterium]|nr:leucine-rich repeat protein [Clostridia bacterium]
MKSLKRIVAFILVLALSLIATACTGGKLATPSGFYVDDENTLHWSVVAEARSYRVEVKALETDETMETVVRRAEFSMSDFVEGDYELRVMAVGGTQNGRTSDWSEVFSFHKDYETGLVYSLINGGTEYQITRVGTASGHVVIEDYYRNKPVTSIADGAFRGSSRLESLVIGNNVKSIGNDAFYNCSRLTSITIPDSVIYIGENAFQNCYALSAIKLPAEITQITSYMFAYCRELKSVQLGEKVRSIAEGAFYGCSALISFVIPDSVESIGANAFYATSEEPALKSVTIGSGLKQIASRAFYGNSALEEVKFAEEGSLTSIALSAFEKCTSLTEIEIPEGVTTLENRVFYGCASLKDVTIPESLVSVGSHVFSGTKLYRDQENSGFIYVGDWLVGVTDKVKNETLTRIDADTFKEGTIGIANNTFQYSKALTRVTLPDSVRYIGVYTFSEAANMTYFYAGINSQLEEIGYAAFSSCALLNNVQFRGSNLKTIGDYAFFSCLMLQNNELFADFLVPESVTRVGMSAYAYSGLFNSPEENGLVYAGNWVIGYDPELMTEPIIELKEGTNGIADYAFAYCEDLSSITGLNTLENLGYGAFYDCQNLSSVTLNRNLRAIQPYTFYNCKRLFRVGLPSMLTTIGNAAFYSCERLYELDLSGCSRLVEIGTNAFAMAGIATLSLNDGLETIGANAFYRCYQLEEVVIPDSVKTIGSRAFAMPGIKDGWIIVQPAGGELKSVTLGAGVEYIGYGAFRDCAKLKSIVIPDSVKTIESHAFYRCTGFKTINFGSGVEYIGDNAFYGCQAITSLVIPKSVQYIGYNAFKNCTALTSVVLSGTVDYIDEHAFYGNNRMTVYVNAEGAGENWVSNWNSSFRPVAYNATFSEDGTYLESITVGSLINPYAIYGLSAPAREGYVFLGWSTRSGATEAEYPLVSLARLEAGTVLYTVWEIAPEVEEEEEEEVPEEEFHPGQI